VTASAVVAALQTYAKINSACEWIDRKETVSMNNLFDRMSTQELEAYVQTGSTLGIVKIRKADFNSTPSEGHMDSDCKTGVSRYPVC